MGCNHNDQKIFGFINLFAFSDMIKRISNEGVGVICEYPIGIASPLN